MRRLLSPLILALVAAGGCSQEAPPTAPPPTAPPETAQDISSTSQPSGSTEAPSATGSNLTQALSNPQPNEDGVYDFVYGSKITTPKQVHQGEFDFGRFKGDQAVSAALTAQVVIDVDGTVRDAELVSGVNPELDAAFLESVEGYLFEPATLDGKPVPVKFYIVFRLDGS